MTSTEDRVNNLGVATKIEYYKKQGDYREASKILDAEIIKELNKQTPLYPYIRDLFLMNNLIPSIDEEKGTVKIHIVDLGCVIEYIYTKSGITRKEI